MNDILISEVKQGLKQFWFVLLSYFYEAGKSFQFIFYSLFYPFLCFYQDHVIFHLSTFLLKIFHGKFGKMKSWRLEDEEFLVLLN